MSSKPSQPWVPLEKIDVFLQFEPALVIIGLVLSAWLISRAFLRQIPIERQRNMNALFRNLGYHLFFGTTLYLTYFALNQLPFENPVLDRLMTYIGLGAILSGAAIFVKVWRILVFEYLFLSHKKVAFPVLLVNLFTLLLSIILASWIGAEIFNIRLTALLATSAIFSLVLGLALQDTLGNLFAGVALQFDKPYEIGDWIEIQTGTQKWIGQVYEISWRATVLIGFTEETITVPNRIMGQAQIANFSTKFRPIQRSQIFRLPFGVDLDQVKWTLTETAKAIPEIRKIPSPKVLVTETNESWIGFKLIYFIDNYGTQYSIADQIITRGITQLEAAGFQLASQRIQILGDNPPKK